MAKQGTITAPTGADENLKSLGAATPVRDTLAGVVREALRVTTDLKKAIINFGVRKAVIVPTAQSVATVIAATADNGYFTKDAPESASSPMTFHPTVEGFDENVQPLLAALVEERKPSYTIESLTNGIEDLQEKGLLPAGHSLVVIQDQGNERVYVGSTSTPENAHNAAVAYVEDVQFVQTLNTSSGAQFGE